MMRKFILFIAVLAIAGYAHGEMLENGNIDDPCDMAGWSAWGSGTGMGWNGWGAAVSWYGGNWWNVINDPCTAHTDDKYMELGNYLSTGHSSWWGWAWTAMWQANQMPITEGQEVTLSAYVRNGAGYTDPQDPCAIGVALLKMEWYYLVPDPCDPCGPGIPVMADIDGSDPCGGVGDKWDMPIYYYDATNDWSLITMTETVPVGFDIELMQVVVGTESLNVNLNFDTVSLVPEPASIALFGLGSTLLLRRRKRK